MPSTATFLQQADGMLQSGILDSQRYDEIENFILKHDAQLSADPDFQRLKTTMEVLAFRFGLRDISSIQENFGLNSCAQ